MDVQTEHGYIVLADISGYTSYVATTELAHAQNILSELLEVVVNHLTPTLTLSRLQGDAVIAYAPESRLTRDETLLELVEATYMAFKDRVVAVRRSTTCECNACKAIPTLDLKFIVHHGDYIVQSVAGIKEMVGTDVNLAHRLLKNSVSEATGWHGYALFTEAALEHMCLVPASMYEHTESYEHLGDVRTYTINLADRYKAATAARRIFITPEEADIKISEDVVAPPPVVWEWLNDPNKRTLYDGLTHQPQKKPGERSGVGTRNHCVHGKDVMVQTIVDWRPFEYFTLKTVQPPSKDVTLTTFRLTATPEGTRVDTYVKISAPAVKKVIMKMVMGKMFKQAATKMASLIAESEKGPAYPQKVAVAPNHAA